MGLCATPKTFSFGTVNTLRSTEQQDGLDIRPRLQSLAFQVPCKVEPFFARPGQRQVCVLCIYQPSCWEARWNDAHASLLRNSQDDGTGDDDVIMSKHSLVCTKI